MMAWHGDCFQSFWHKRITVLEISALLQRLIQQFGELDNYSQAKCQITFVKRVCYFGVCYCKVLRYCFSSLPILFLTTSFFPVFYVSRFLDAKRTCTIHRSQIIRRKVGVFGYAGEHARADFFPLMKSECIVRIAAFA